MRDPDAAAREALRLIGPDPQNWVPDRPGIDHNVVIVGGGQSGCAFAFALRRAGHRPGHGDRQGRGRGAGRRLAQCGADECIAHAKDLARTGIRHCGVEFPGVVRSAVTGRRPMPRSIACRAQIGPSISPGTAGFSASRSATAPGCGASSRRTSISACHLEFDGAAKSRPRGKSSLPPASKAMAGPIFRRYCATGLPAHLYAHTAERSILPHSAASGWR